MKISKRALSMVLALVLAIGSLAICVYADEPIKSGVAFVDATALRLRSGPNTNSSTLDTAYDNEVVVVLERSGEWYKVIYNLQEGYMHGAYLDIAERENVELGYGQINAYCVNLRSGPSTSYSIVTQAYEGAKAYIIGINCGWYKVIYKDDICYVRSDLMDLTEYPYENRDSSNTPKFFRGGNSLGTKPSASALNGSGNTGSSDTTNVPTVTPVGEQLVAAAKQYLGVPYVWGGSSPNGFDCSGFVQYVARSCGISVGRTVSQQWPYGAEVSKENLQPGDIVFFVNTYTSGFSHVGIYVGGGEFIHASSYGGVKISDLNSDYYSGHYYGARRLG